MLVEATAAKDPARFHRKEKNRPYRDTRINPCVAMGVSQSPLGDNLEQPFASCISRVPSPIPIEPELSTTQKRTGNA